jgi:hypothetical protein
MISAKLAAVAAVVMMTLMGTTPDALLGSDSAYAEGKVPAGSPAVAYADGAANAPNGAPDLPALFHGYTVRPPWRVAGVDYHVGIPSGVVLKDPTVPGSLPGNTRLDVAHHTIIIAGNGVTVSGFDFSGDGGYGIYVGAGVTDTKIVNNLFVDGSPSTPIPVNIASGASDTYVARNTMDGGGAAGNQTYDQLISNQGTGLTVEYNLMKNAPGRFVSCGSGRLVYRYNLLMNGGWHSGVHLNFLQFSGGDIPNPVVDFNTLVQARAAAGGEGFQMYTNDPGAITGGDIGYNTMISMSSIIEAGNPGPAISYWIHAGSNRQTPSPSTGTVHDNYVDTTSAYGAIYPGLAGFTYRNNVDLRTGSRD